jgi:protein-tyrosine phosphatase
VSPLARVTLVTERRRVVLATRYLVGGLVVAGLAIWIGGGWLWLLWPAISLLLVAANYAFLGREGFQKDADGRMSLAARVLLAPYLAGAFLNSRSWTRREPNPVAIAGGVWLGRIPGAHDTTAFANVVDLCAELPGASSGARWICVPVLDLVPPSAAQLRSAAAHIERARSAGPVLVCCALGYSRSAAAVATWLLTSRMANTSAEAIDQVRVARPRIVIDTALRDRIATAAEPAI